MSNLGSGRPGVSPQDCGSIREIKNSSATPMPTPTQTFNFHFWRKQRATTRMFGLSQNTELNILFFPTAFCRPQKIKIQRFWSSSKLLLSFQTFRGSKENSSDPFKVIRLAGLKIDFSYNDEMPGQTRQKRRPWDLKRNWMSVVWFDCWWGTELALQLLAEWFFQTKMILLPTLR